MTKCINSACHDCHHCARYEQHAGLNEPVVCPDGTPDCELFILKED